VSSLLEADEISRQLERARSSQNQSTVRSFGSGLRRLGSAILSAKWSYARQNILIDRTAASCAGPSV